MNKRAFKNHRLGKLYKCTTCQKWKLESQFYIDNRATSGLNSNCKNCINTKYKEWSKQHPEIVKQRRHKTNKNNPWYTTLKGIISRCNYK